MRLASIAIFLACLTSPAVAQTRGALAELSLEELSNLEVTSVSRSAESVANAPAAIYVITSEDIRRSGAVTLPEALRLAPTLHVAQTDAGQYAISARGFNNAIANKLLVLVDGRTIYTPLFSGVFWDQQDVLLEDVERIEVISGPGGTIWGANAVNGVINVITRSPRETQGTLASVGAGTERQGAAFRYGGSFGSDAAFRVYGKVTHTEHTQRANGTSALDDRRLLQAGFRADWGSVQNGATLQGDAHGVRSEDRGSVAGFVLGRAELSGLNLLGRWRRELSTSSHLQLQAYVDHSRRDENVLFQPESDLYDVELQHELARRGHQVIWGAGYRHARDRVEDGILVGFRPANRNLNWVNTYVQDTVQLRDALQLRAGIKFERNDYSGWDYLPNCVSAGRLARASCSGPPRRAPCGRRPASIARSSARSAGTSSAAPISSPKSPTSIRSAIAHSSPGSSRGPRRATCISGTNCGAAAPLLSSSRTGSRGRSTAWRHGPRGRRCAHGV